MEIKNIKIYFLFLIIILFYNTNTFSTDLPKNYKEGVYTQSFKDNLLVAQNDNTDSKFYKCYCTFMLG